MEQSTTTAPFHVALKVCNLPQWKVCNLNPLNGRSFEKIVKRSIEQSLDRQGVTGIVRLNNEREKARLPDIFLDVADRRLSIDCKYWTRTEHRNGRIYLSREFYGSTRFEPSLLSHLQDSRIHFVGWSLSVTDPGGHKKRLLFFVPGKWILDQFKQHPGIKIDSIAESWTGYEKTQDLLYYDIDIIGLLQVADTYPAGVI